LPLEDRESVLRAADARLEIAKASISRAALSCLRGKTEAAQHVRAALLAVEDARAELRRLSDDHAELKAAAPSAKVKRQGAGNA
jgi:hypothetical protein